MVIVDERGAIVLVNVQAERLFGYDRSELLGQPVEVLVPDAVRPKHPAHRAAYFANPRLRPMGAGLELNGRRKDGSEIAVEISLSPLETREGVLVSRRDPRHYGTRTDSGNAAKIGATGRHRRNHYRAGP